MRLLFLVLAGAIEIAANAAEPSSGSFAAPDPPMPTDFTVDFAKANDPWSLDSAGYAERAAALFRIGDLTGALSASASATALAPRNIDMYLLRANILRRLKRDEDALKEAAAAQAAAPDLAYAQLAAAAIYSKLDRIADAVKAYDRAIAIRPDASAYLNRALKRPKADVAGRTADIDAVLKLDPSSINGLEAKALLQTERNDHAGAVATWSVVMERMPGYLVPIVRRGISRMRAGDSAGGRRDFAQARALATSAPALNELCWMLAVVGVGLETALAACDAAVRLAPDQASYIDSRAFVLLRLGRLDDAISAYDTALAMTPTKPSSLYGRSVAWARKGDGVRADIVLAAALKADPDVRDRFEGYGIAR
ncbi:tetratricopeptide repeat protein [Sphingomonas montanisoli]|nr:tetratricopeptide repeat protein [Sphingomonas montanisoli]